MSKVNDVGRPTKMTTITLGKLREAFLWGCTDKEACLYADIHPDTLYDYQVKNPKYSEEKKLFKDNPVLVARRAVVNALESDPKLALRYLERKRSSEFSLRQTVDQNINTERITGITYVVPDKAKFSKENLRENDKIILKSDVKK
jgi:hypothetical protein